MDDRSWIGVEPPAKASSLFDTKQAGLPTIEMVTKYWVAKSDGLFRKQESNGTEAGMKIKTTETYEYDPSITIEAPIP
jgi:hypothetical protein